MPLCQGSRYPVSSHIHAHCSGCKKQVNLICYTSMFPHTLTPHPPPHSTPPLTCPDRTFSVKYHTQYSYYLQTISVLNHCGVCVSYNTAWKYLKQLTQEARYLEVVRDGHWQWVYDNLNALQSVQHEREGSIVTTSQHNIEHQTYRLSFTHDECDSTPRHQDQISPRFSLPVVRYTARAQSPVHYH